MKKLKKITKQTILLLLGLFLIYLILNFIGIDKIIKVLLKANPFYLILALILEFLVLYIMTVRWKYLLKVLGYNPSTKILFLLILIGQAVNNTTPSMRGGGEPVRIYYLSKLLNIPEGKATSSVFVERAIDTIIFIIFSLIVILYILISYGLRYVESLILGLIFFTSIIGVIVYLIINKDLLIKIVLKSVKISCKYLKKDVDENKILMEIENFYESLNFFKDKKKDINFIIAIILSFLWYIVDITKVYFFFLSISYAISIFLVATIYFVTFLSGVISITPAGVGSSDAVMILTSSLFNVPPSISATVTILDRLITYLIPTILGGLVYKYIKLLLKRKVRE